MAETNQERGVISNWFYNGPIGRLFGIDDETKKKEAEAEALAKAQAAATAATAAASTTTTQTEEKPNIFVRLWRGFKNSWFGRLIGINDEETEQKKQTPQTTQIPTALKSANNDNSQARTTQRMTNPATTRQSTGPRSVYRAPISQSSVQPAQPTQPQQPTQPIQPAQPDPKTLQSQLIAKACEADIKFDKAKRALLEQYNATTDPAKQAQIEEQLVLIANQQHNINLELDKNMANYAQLYGEEALSQIPGAQDRLAKIERQKNSPLYTAPTATNLADEASDKILTSNPTTDQEKDTRAVEGVCRSYKRTSDFYDEVTRMGAIAATPEEKEACRNAQFTAGTRQTNQMPQMNQLLDGYASLYGQESLKNIPSFQKLTTDEQRKEEARQSRTSGVATTNTPSQLNTPLASPAPNPTPVASNESTTREEEEPVTAPSMLRSTLAAAQTRKETPASVSHGHEYTA